MLLFERQVNLVCNSDNACICLIVLATAQNCLDECRESFLRGVELIHFIDNDNVMLFLANFCCCSLFFCLLFDICTSFATKGLSHEEGNFFVIDGRTAHANYLLTCFFLSHVLKEAECEASDVGERHCVVHIKLEFIRFAEERFITQRLQDLV